MPSRRTVLSGCLGGFAAVLAGCTSGGSDASSSPACLLSHEALSSESYDASGPKNVSYGDLSKKGKDIFTTAVEEGGYSFEYNGSNAPADYSYSDEATAYRIDYRNVTYILLTYTGEGCTGTVDAMNPMQNRYRTVR